MNKVIFREIGFTEGEIKVYFALLDVGESTSGPLIKKSGISGSKVYEILDKLIDKGLVSYVVKEKTKYFQVASTTRLLDYIDSRRKELDEQSKEIKDLLPELEHRRKGVKGKRESFVLEGFGGVKTFFKMIRDGLKRGEEYYVVTLGPDLRDENVLNLLHQHHLLREEKGIGIKILMNISDKKVMKDFKKYKRMQTKFIGDPLPVGTFIFRDYVANVKFGPDDPLIFVMKSKEIADSYKEFFWGLWKKAKT